jgi:asparagine synthase (glutamine-hydrolysing)
VIVEAWLEWGEDCLNYFRGMFAFVLVDRRKSLLFAARDRFGIKPLYFVQNNKGTTFASEIKQLLPFLGSRKINAERARDFLVYGAQDHTAETLFDGVFQIRGGESALIDLRFGPTAPWTAKPWYSLDGIAPFEGSFEEAAHEYRKLFREVVALHLRSDVPLGSCLSGGMDSSAVVCTTSGFLADNPASEQQKVFHCTYPFPGCDESTHARAVAAQANARIHFLTPEGTGLLSPVDGYGNLLEQIVWHQDEPLNNASIFSQFCVFRAAAEAGLKVMLDGQGGDEQLASYPQFYGPFLLSLLNRGRLAEALHEAGRLNDTQGWTWRETARSLFLWHAPDFISGLARKIIPRQYRFPWATRGFITGGKRLTPPWKRPAFYSHEISTGWMSRMMLTQLTLPMLLHWEDRNSMAHSLEARVPFMDHKLVEFSLSLPDSFKISNGDTKVVLKSAMQGLVPRQVINRRDKKGFATPEENWLRQNPGNEWNRLLQQAASDSPEIFDKPALDSMWQNFLSSKQPAPPILWRAITFGVWRRVFDVKM